VLADGDTPRALDEAELDEVEARIDAWARRQLSELEVVDAVERGEGDERRWFVRVRGEAKDVFSIWLTLRQRTLLYETYFIPAPEENAEQLYEYVLRRNLELFGASFCIGEENAVFLRGHLPSESVTDAELDRVLGSMYAWVERFFRPMLAIGFASRFS
jgi:Putative bacterial sensory transduction regulator